ncbi:hypothetical protein CC80DRAFT_491109 [Byssothecium circinans]|uniref:Uncharacterized protein n=1 Tax=Byssothecium circinans TaxID=147558 RepID=A0A6A5U1B4_9PLEO|nr:hypothetical protein CC80DRAFT_491109 [Byssothecium circinans]
MSDYGDDLSDYGDDWLYIEEEYMVADDLAEHAVQSPPPTTYDDDQLEEWDRYEYFLDIDYASDGYDDVKLEPKNGTGDTKIGKKRKRATTATPVRSRKKHKPVQSHLVGQSGLDMITNSPVVWRSQGDRDARPKVLEENAESYALMKDWREKLANMPKWARQSSHSASPAPTASNGTKLVPTPQAPASYIDIENDGEEEEQEGEGASLDPAAILAVLQERLAAEGGPLSGMNPEQILQFAMRMANGEDAGDEVAGEMADEMLNNMMGDGEGDDEDEEAEANLLSWVAQQRNTTNNATTNGGSSELASASQAPAQAHDNTRPLTPPSSEANRSVRHEDQVTEDIESDAAASAQNKSQEVSNGSRKRKATDTAEVDGLKSAPKKRATRSYEASTAASQARAAPPKATRSSGRSKR